MPVSTTLDKKTIKTSGNENNHFTCMLLCLQMVQNYPLMNSKNYSCRKKNTQYYWNFFLKNYERGKVYEVYIHLKVVNVPA